MSTGRHARKRAAQTEERLANEQEQLLKKEEAKKGEMEKDLEGQRIATMRARFGGQAPDESARNDTTSAANNPATSPGETNMKFKTPVRLTNKKTDPMRATLMNMMLNNDVGDQS